MKVNFTKESVLAMKEDLDYDKAFLKNVEKFANEVLRNKGYIFLNEVLNNLGIKPVKRGQLDGWIYDELNSEKKDVIKFKVKVENGEIILNLNEEKDIIDDVFEED